MGRWSFPDPFSHFIFCSPWQFLLLSLFLWLVHTQRRHSSALYPLAPHKVERLFLHSISLAKPKWLKYLTKISDFLHDHSSSWVFKKCALSILGTLSHITIVHQDGCSYLSALTAFISTFGNIHIPQYPNHKILNIGECTNTTYPKLHNVQILALYWTFVHDSMASTIMQCM